MTTVIHFMFWSLLNELHNKNILSVFKNEAHSSINPSICQSVHPSIRQSVIQSVNQSRPLISSSSVLSSSHLNTPRVSLHHSGSTRSFLVSVIHLEAYLAVTSFHPPSVTLMYKITKHNNHQSTHENGLRRQYSLLPLVSKLNPTQNAESLQQLPLKGNWVIVYSK